MDALVLVQGVAGLLLLLLGADWLVRASSKLAVAAGVSPLVVGLTVVAFGTSAPELAVSVQGAATGHAEAAFGNVVGSNLYNTLLILGVAALVSPLAIKTRLVKVDVPVMILVSGAVLVLSWDGVVGRWEGVGLAAGLAVYTVWAVLHGRRERAELKQELFGKVSPVGPGTAGIAAQGGVVVVALGMLVLGSRWLLTGAVEVAVWAGLSERVIGLTLVAAGTSLPETTASVIAAVRGERDIAVGNVVGSNIFNLLGVLGVSSIVADGGLPVPPAGSRFDLFLMLLAAAACLPVFFTDCRIDRREGALFLVAYVVYVSCVVLESPDSGIPEQVFRTVKWLTGGVLVIVPIVAVLLRKRVECGAGRD